MPEFEVGSSMRLSFAEKVQDSRQSLVEQTKHQKIKPVPTLYVRNLNDKIKTEGEYKLDCSLASQISRSMETNECLFGQK